MSIIENFEAVRSSGLERGFSGRSLRAGLVSAATRLYPFYSGSGRIANHPLMRKLVGETARVCWAEVEGGRMLAPLDDHVGRAAFFCRDLDPKLSWIVDRALRAGETALDVGANLGLVTLRMASRVGAQGTVHAFEPNPSVLRFLRLTLGQLASPAVRLHEFGLGETACEAVITAPLDNLGSGTVTDATFDGPTMRQKIMVRRLDETVDPDMPVSLMKVDVEGFEMAVFRGARAKFENGSIAAVVFEEHGRCYADRAPETLSLLAGFGYDIYAVPRCMVRMRLVPLAQARARRLDCHDYVAVAPNAAGARARGRLGLS